MNTSSFNLDKTNLKSYSTLSLQTTIESFSAYVLAPRDVSAFDKMLAHIDKMLSRGLKCCHEKDSVKGYSICNYTQ